MSTEVQYRNLVKKYEKAVGKLRTLNTEKANRENRKRELQGFVDSLMSSLLVLDAWDEQLWTLLMVKRTMQRDRRIEFEFVGGKIVVTN